MVLVNDNFVTGNALLAIFLLGFSSEIVAK